MDMNQSYHDSPARLRSLAIAVPPFVISQREVITRAHHLFDAAAADDLARMLPVYGNAGVETRYSCVPPDWYEGHHGWAEKNRLYLEHAAELLEQAAVEALVRAGLTARDVGAIVAVSTTGIATPSLDALIIERLDLPRTVERLPVFGLGCAGGVIGLARAATLARVMPGQNVLFLVVELCGLTFRRADWSKSNMVGTALFGDGAAAAVISTEADGPAFAHWGSHTWPDSLDVMGWSVQDDGLGVIFSRDIPTLTRTEFRSVMHDYLGAHALKLSDIDEFVCHPGGAKVLDALEDAFELQRGGLELSRGVLRDYGNMSAATVLFVLQRTLNAGRSGRFLLSALGPGFTAAFLTIEDARA
jgi:alkylresorcinol/alkylpyrone synthase